MAGEIDWECRYSANLTPSFVALCYAEMDDRLCDHVRCITHYGRRHDYARVKLVRAKSQELRRADGRSHGSSRLLRIGGYTEAST
jgi:hypothetical protein